ncbi:MAG: hypothetical protein AAFR87_16620 [Bacteroidota bacterium]
MSNQKKDANYHHKNWLIKAPLGLSLIGFGLCLVTEAAMQKYSGVDTVQWVLFGTLALVVVNAGISIFGGAVVHRSHFERLEKKEE